MIDERRIVEAQKAFIADKKILGIIAMNDLACGFEQGAKWAINELLKDLFHPASEVPRNDNGKVLVFSKEIGHRKLYDMNAMLDEIDCGDYQEMWEFEVKAYRWTNWIFIEEWFDMIRKGGEQ